jgi:hypothetical protein
MKYETVLESRASENEGVDLLIYLSNLVDEDDGEVDQCGNDT